MKLDNHTIKNNYWTMVKIWVFIITVLITLFTIDIKVYLDAIHLDATMIIFLIKLLVPIIIMGLLLHLQMANQFDQLLKSHHVLACWFFTEEEWLHYVDESLYVVCSRFAFINLLVFSIIYSGIVTNSFAFIAITEFITISIYIIDKYIRHIYRSCTTAYVFLSTTTVSINGRLYIWAGINRLEKVIYSDNIISPVIFLTYSSPGRYSGRVKDTIKIPVPIREKGKVGKIIDELTAVMVKQKSGETR